MAISSIQLFCFRVVEYPSSPCLQDNRCTSRTPYLNDMGWGAPPPSNSAAPGLLQWKSTCTPPFFHLYSNKALTRPLCGEWWQINYQPQLVFSPDFWLPSTVSWQSPMAFLRDNGGLWVFLKIVVPQNGWFIHPGRLTWNLQITQLERKIIFQTSMIMFHVNLPGCNGKPYFLMDDLGGVSPPCKETPL